MSGKSIVYYYSRTGNTKRIAEQIAVTLGGDIEALQDAVEYSGAVGFFKAGRDAFRSAVHEIAPLAHPPAAYDLVIVGQPVWAARPVPAVNGLLGNYDLSGRKVALFVTFDGGGDAHCLEATEAHLKAGQVVAKASFLKVGKKPEENLKKAQQWAESLRPM